MKKTTLWMVALLVSGSAMADIAVQLQNSGGYVTEAGSGGSAGVDQVLVQLIWSSSDAAQANATNTDLLGSGEYLLESLLTTSGNWGVWGDLTEYYTGAKSTMTFLDADVGDNDINNGYIFVRLFDNAALEEGDYYLQQFVKGPSLTEYDAIPVPTPYNTEGVLGALDPDLGGGSDIDLQGHQVVPEPAVASLIGIAGLGMLFGRRIFRKD